MERRELLVGGQIEPGDPLGVLRIVGNCTLNTSGGLQTYVIEAATDLADSYARSAIATNTLPGSTLGDFVDSASTNYSSRLYRAHYAP